MSENKSKNKRKEKPVFQQNRRFLYLLEAVVVIVAIVALVRWFVNDSGIGLNANDLYQVGYARIGEFDYEGAVDAFSDSIRADYSPITDAYNGRALAYKALGQFDNAINDYTTSLSLDPDCELNCEETYINRALIYVELEEYELALADYNQAIEFAPDSADAFRNRAELYAIMKNDNGFLADWDATLEQQAVSILRREIPTSGGIDIARISNNGWQVHYSFDAQTGDTVDIEIVDASFDTVLMVRDWRGRPIAFSDDISADETRSQISDLQLTENNTYTIIVAGYTPRETGDFEISVTLGK